MIRLFSATLAILISVNGFSQSGFFGKKTSINIDGTFRSALIYGMLYKGEYSPFPGEKSVMPSFVGGFTAGISHSVSSTLGFGIDFSMYKSQIRVSNSMNAEFYDFYNYFAENHANYTLQSVNMYSPRMSTFYVMPKIEWSRRGNLPIGLVYSLGVGYSNSKIVDETLRAEAIIFSYETEDGYYGSSTQESISIDRKVDSKLYTSHGAVVEFGVKLRYAITRFMTLNVGSNLRLHVPSPKTLEASRYNVSFEPDAVKNMMRYGRGSNLMDVRVGLSFILF